MMEISDLRIFSAVVHNGGITRAARHLNRVQSNVTTRIRQLEDDLGISLFVREGKSLRISPAGSILLGYAEQILTLAEQARRAVHDTNPFGLFRLGTMESTAAARLPEPLYEFHECYPAVSIELQTGAPRDQIALVIAGELDAALIAEPVNDRRLDTLVIFEEELVFVGSAKHPPITSPQDARPRTALVFHPGCPHRTRLEDWFARAGVVIDRVVELTSYHAMLGCAAAGMGIALMPLSVLETYSKRESLSIHPILDSELNTARTLLVWRRDVQHPTVERFAEVLLRHSKATGA